MTAERWMILGLALCLVGALGLVTVAATLATGELLAKAYDLYWGTRLKDAEEVARLRESSDKDLRDYDALKRQYDAVARKITELQREHERVIEDNRNLRNKVARYDGQSLVEYAVIVVLLVIVVAVAVPPIGQWVAQWVLILANRFNQV